LLESVLKILDIKEYEILQTIKGSELEGIKCKNPVVERISIGVLGEFVSQQEGTGIVHIAPGHGEDDYRIGLKYNLPVI
ncbi:MAG: class I tRNA ligase family protein, partial [Elusimicrobiota bacterium]|nr:class I tRNA ligase family protein [Elusimicrobiota bacterium]